MSQDKLHLSDKISAPAKADILDLQQKINAFKSGQILEERFKSFRLTRGVYGQRQLGVQMFRIKIPYGKLTTPQLVRIAEISEEYTNGNLHTTTRQNIQLHYVHLEDTPAMWAKLEEVGVTTKEACGNTVRNVTASDIAGIDPDELFDVAPYAEATFRYFLRNPICQDMGRKIKIAFSSSDKDSAYTYFHDFGFIPRVKIENGEEVRGFKVVVGGGLGAQPFIAETAFEFLHEDKIIPFMNAALRIFDRLGEREKRMKARLKFLLDPKRGITLDQYKELIEQEYTAIPDKTFKVDRSLVEQPEIPAAVDFPQVEIKDVARFEQWKRLNLFEQKQKGFYAVNIKLQLGNISSATAKALAALVEEGVAANDIRVTINQGLMLKYVRPEALPYLYTRLDELGLAEPGFGTIADVTACPGTDTCNLGVTNSTGVAQVLEELIKEEYPELIGNSRIDIKISGCMNSCGQHMAASIGLHGSSIKHGELVVPAMQIVLGGGVDPSGKGYVAEKIIKLPTKKIKEAFRLILDDYDANATEGEYFNDYVARKGKMHFYGILKPLADLSKLAPADYVDWGHDENFIPEIGMGECAGVSYDVVGTIITDAQERFLFSRRAFEAQKYADAIYHAYSTFIIGAKALLLSKDVHCNTHQGIMNDFNTHYYQSGDFALLKPFDELVLQINKNEPSAEFAQAYMQQADEFLANVIAKRQEQVALANEAKDKVVIDTYYKA
ncbi:nitrite reductase [Cesiribacter sp. SM1]|uniref:nitrite reductase n=1 Tax=Cesiribacter sp. SM1 TaxID=2861196 RepID=UPI001CD66F63|nr:nitrite reductase [Cesiribacter sp. SM1]